MPSWYTSLPNWLYHVIQLWAGDMHSAEEEPGRSAERLAYSVNEAAQLTGLSRDLLYDQMRRGNLPYVKIGRRRLITRQHLEQFLGAVR
jgi:excisionase family DNA binding protein